MFDLFGNEVTNRKQYSSAFQELWEIYPRKTSKQQAKKAWDKVKNKDEVFEKIYSSILLHSKTKQWKKDGGQFIPHFSTFLNQERWEDEIDPKEIIDDEITKPIYL